MPAVGFEYGLKVSLVMRLKRAVLPTPLSPSIRLFNMTVFLSESGGGDGGESGAGNVEDVCWAVLLTGDNVCCNEDFLGCIVIIFI